MQNEFPQAEIKVLRGRFPSEALEKKDSVFLPFPGSRDVSIAFLGVCPLPTPSPQVALERRAWGIICLLLCKPPFTSLLKGHL